MAAKLAQAVKATINKSSEHNASAAAAARNADLHMSSAVSNTLSANNATTSNLAAKPNASHISVLQKSTTNSSLHALTSAIERGNLSSSKRLNASANFSSNATATSSTMKVAREAVLAVKEAAELLPEVPDSGIRPWVVRDPFAVPETSPDNEDAEAPAVGLAAQLAAAPAKAALLQKQPSPEATVNCEADCSGHGTCEDSGRCACAAGWTGSICDMPMCADNCNDRGLCVQGNCICESGWYGSTCHLQRCPNDCSGAGYCFKGKCKCMSGFKGESCSEVYVARQSMVVKLKKSNPLPARPGLDTFREAASLRAAGETTCPENCNNRGTCSPVGRCRCNAGYSGAACESFCPNECSGQGRCIEGGCLCFAGFTGVDCSVQGCCSGHGTCDVPGTCECNAGYGGPECSIRLVCIDPACSEHGTCTNGVCECEDGWSGPTCAASTGGCVPQCGPKGKCNAASKQCECEKGYTGEDCTIKLESCLNNCNFKGLCLNGICMCGEGWAGQDCSRRYFAPGGVAASMLTGAANLPGGPMPGNGKDSRAGAEFALDANGERADLALDESLGPEPRIGLDYKPAPEPTTFPPMYAAMAMSLASPAPTVTGGSAAVANSGDASSMEAAKVQLAGAMSPEAVATSAAASLALQSAEAAAVARLVPSLASGGKICGEGGLCSGRGTCNTETGTCECESSFSGDVCQHQRCPGFLETGKDCHGNGICESGKCFCSAGWGGVIPGSFGLLSCHEKVCALGCGNHGSCNDGACACETGWKGETCQDPHCPSGCGGHGTCGAPSPDFPGECTCDDGWTGTNCDAPVQPEAQNLRHKQVSILQLTKGFAGHEHRKHVEVSSVQLPSR
eukprot:TRINITY_DN36319_c0_g1_i1.p1 TRINITY_DN36319_c0_g1~~TRINITY_DN36319_c0_g1_i1.p1  ORF type:complete len:921 (+),score=197.61 TRINITY_DN36319_c0_g1_i1:211-2763(+)